MSLVPALNEPQSLYELAWTDAPGSMFAFDANTGVIVDANPAAEAMMGSTREELIGMHQSLLHPETEREAARAEFRKAAERPSPHTGFHLLRKNGACVPVWASSSRTILLAGRSVMIVICRDITEIEQKTHELATQNWALSAYAIAALALGGAHTTEVLLLQAICEAVTRDSAYALAYVGIAEHDSEKRVRVAASAGSSRSYLDGMSLSWSEGDLEGLGPTGLCIRTGQVQTMPDSETATEFVPWRERARQNGIRSTVSIPLSIEGGWHGALVVGSALTDAFDTISIEVFKQLAGQIGEGIHAAEQARILLVERESLARMQGQLTEALSAMVAPMVAAMEMRDPYTAGHENRVAGIAVAIGREMGWSEERLQGMRVAAQVHDIGKISIPAEILTKPVRLSPGERILIREHPETGYTILRDIPFSWPIAEIVRQHHERLDGSGYPRGLKGEAILPEAKVLAVADVTEAMATARPYRPAIKMSTVLQEIQKQAGTQLDVEAVRICVSLFRDKRLNIPAWIRA